MSFVFPAVIVPLPVRPNSQTFAFSVRARQWAEAGTDMVVIHGLDDKGKKLFTRQQLMVSLEDLPLLLAGIRKALAGPLEALLIDAEAHASRLVGGG